MSNSKSEPLRTTVRMNEILDEFQRLKPQYEPTPLDLVTGNNQKGQALLNSVQLATLTSIGCSLERIADALEKIADKE